MGLSETPLKGLRILDVGAMIAGPLAATLLGDLGAEVIKVEHPEFGDPMRVWTPMKNGRSLWWKVIGRNKKLITLNLSKPKGQELVKRLVERTDILIENFRPGTMERWNLGYEQLSRVNPGLVMVRVSGFGQTGPYRRRPGYGTIAEAMTGIPYFTGFPDKPPTLSAFALADSVAAVFAAFGALVALHHRSIKGTGEGQEVDVSLYEPLFRLVESQVIGYDQLGIIKERRGNRLEEDSPRNAYETSDGHWLAISASSPRTWERLCHALDRADLIDDPRFIDNPARVENADELDAIIAEWFRDRSSGEALKILDAHDVVVGLVYSIADIFEDPQYRARESIIDVSDEDFGSVKMPAAVPKFSKTPGRVVHSGRGIGADNDEIYREWLGLSEEEIAELRADKVI